jgi:Mor family transcriptional regulator
MPPKKRSTRRGRREMMRILYADGWTVRAIAARYECSFQNVHQILIRVGTTMRSRGGSRGSHSRHRK